MGILDIMFENMKTIEQSYLDKNHNKSGNEYLIAVFSEIIKNNNYDLILDENAKNVLKNRIGKDAIVLDALKACIDYYSTFHLLDISDEDNPDLVVDKSIVASIISTGGRMNINNFISSNLDKITSISRIYVDTVQALNKKIRQESVKNTSSTLNELIEFLNKRQKHLIIDPSILEDKKNISHF